MSNFGFTPTNNISHHTNPIFSLDHVHQQYFQPSDYEQYFQEDNSMGFKALPSKIDHVKPQEIIPSIPFYRASELPWTRSEVQEDANDGLGCRIAFRTKSDIEIMDDGFKWKKYGKKKVKNSANPRNYYKCSSNGCNVKKRVERDREDSRFVITTYEGVHNHQTPCVNEIPNMDNIPGQWTSSHDPYNSQL
ncbi:hypothetical protein SLA2020_046710 [Shorea laevis]